MPLAATPPQRVERWLLLLRSLELPQLLTFLSLALQCFLGSCELPKSRQQIHCHLLLSF